MMRRRDFLKTVGLFTGAVGLFGIDAFADEGSIPKGGDALDYLVATVAAPAILERVHKEGYLNLKAYKKDKEVGSIKCDTEDKVISLESSFLSSSYIMEGDIKDDVLKGSIMKRSDNYSYVCTVNEEEDRYSIIGGGPEVFMTVGLDNLPDKIWPISGEFDKRVIISGSYNNDGDTLDMTVGSIRFAGTIKPRWGGVNG